jgi:hypothetical protein
MSEHAARATLMRIKHLEMRVRSFARQARMLASMPGGTFDSRDLLREANMLLNELMRDMQTFDQARLLGRSQTRALPSRPPRSSGVGQFEYWGPAPASKWGGELRAAEKSFWQAVQAAKAEIDKLTKDALTGMMSPTRTATEVSSAFDAAMAMVEFLKVLVEGLRKK